MRRILNVLTHTRTLSIIGLIALAAFLFLGADMMQLDLIWPAIVLGAVIALWLVVWLVRRLRARRANASSAKCSSSRRRSRPRPVPRPRPRVRPNSTCCASACSRRSRPSRPRSWARLSGGAALYELPWYMIIGNPAAGKSSAIAEFGPAVPVRRQGKAVMQGVGGTRNCDWFFTTEGILLDTAGRYSVHRGRPRRVVRLSRPAQEAPAEGADQRHHRSPSASPN